MGEILAVVITMGARELVCGEREREERRRGEKQVSGTETFVKMWYINVRCDRHFFKHRSYERLGTMYIVLVRCTICTLVPCTSYKVRCVLCTRRYKRYIFIQGYIHVKRLRI